MTIHVKNPSFVLKIWTIKISSIASKLYVITHFTIIWIRWQSYFIQIIPICIITYVQVNPGSAVNGTIRIFLAPRRREDGQMLTILEQRKYIHALDTFNINESNKIILDLHISIWSFFK